MALNYLISLTWPTFLTILVALCLIYLTSLAFYRLYFHPLSHFPGPGLAAITYFYEFYWDVIQPGRLTWHLVDLHKQYGSILRITPDEVHILDSSYFDELYTRSSTPRHKLPRFSGRFGFKPESFSTWQHDLHRMRRNAINPFFSAKKVTELQPVIRSNLTKLTKRLIQAAKSKDVVAVNLAYMALTGDITTTYAFNRSYNQLDSPNFKTTYDECLKALYTLGNLTIHFPVIFAMIDASPPWLTQIMNPVVMPIVNFYADCEREINSIRKQLTGTPSKPPQTTTTTIFHDLLQTPALPPHEKTDARLGAEAVEIVAAGIITTSWALTVGTYHIATNPQVLSALQSELRTHIPQPLDLNNLTFPATSQKLDWHTLETLPYLSGCVRESIRLSGGVVTRSPRISPNEPLRYKSHTIPAGSTISMTTWHVSHDESIFPDPDTFRPERWLTPTTSSPSKSQPTWAKSPAMDRYLVAFGKGPRQCAGINLAFAELYVTLAVMFRGFRIEVMPETMYERDIRVSHAYLVPYPKMESPGVKVRIVDVLD